MDPNDKERWKKLNKIKCKLRVGNANAYELPIYIYIDDIAFRCSTRTPKYSNQS